MNYMPSRFIRTPVRCYRPCPSRILLQMQNGNALFSKEMFLRQPTRLLAAVSERAAQLRKRFVPNHALNFARSDRVISWRVFLRKRFYKKFSERRWLPQSIMTVRFQ